MMSRQEIIAKAENLISQDKTSEAKKLLLEEGYIKQIDSEIQATYPELIPESPALAKEKRESLSDLFASDVTVRRKASNYIFREGKKEYKNIRAEWLGDPRTINILFEALKDEDAKVVENVTGALWTIGMGGRYLTDLRMYPKFLELLRSSNKETAKYAAFGLKNFHTDEKVETLLEILATETKTVNIEAIVNNFFRTISAKKQKEILPALKTIHDNKKILKNKEIIKKCIERLEKSSDEDGE